MSRAVGVRRFQPPHKCWSCFYTADLLPSGATSASSATVATRLPASSRCTLAGFPFTSSQTTSSSIKAINMKRRPEEKRCESLNLVKFGPQLSRYAADVAQVEQEGLCRVQGRVLPPVRRLSLKYQLILLLPQSQGISTAIIATGHCTPIVPLMHAKNARRSRIYRRLSRR